MTQLLYASISKSFYPTCIDFFPMNFPFRLLAMRMIRQEKLPSTCRKRVSLRGCEVCWSKASRFVVAASLNEGVSCHEPFCLNIYVSLPFIYETNCSHCQQVINHLTVAPYLFMHVVLSSNLRISKFLISYLLSV